MGRIFTPQDSRDYTEKTADAIRQQAEYVFSELIQLYQSLREQIWHLPEIDRVEFNSILQSLGTDGPKVMALMKGLAATINAAAASTISKADIDDPVTLTEDSGELRATGRQAYPGPK